MERRCVGEDCRFGNRKTGMTRVDMKRANVRKEDFERLFAIAVQ